jgi:hypothetical protein
MRNGLGVPARWAVLLIHGVGDTTPGQMLASVTQSIQSINPHLILNARNEHIELRDAAPNEDTAFPVFMRRARAGTDSLLFAEVHWADLTRVGTETHHLILAFAGFVYGLRHIALQAAFIRGWLPATLGIVLRVALFILVGPVFASYLFEAILYFVYLVFIPAEWDVLHGVDHGAVLRLQGALVAAVIGLCILIRRRTPSLLSSSLLGVALLVAVHLVIRSSRRVDWWYATALFPRLNVERGQVPGDWPLTGLIIDYALDRLLAAIATLLIVAGVLVAVARVVADKVTFRSLWTAWLATVLLVALWEIAVAPLDVMAQLAYDKSRDESAAVFTVWYDEACVGALAIALVASSAVASWAQINWAKRARAFQSLPAASVDNGLGDGPSEDFGFGGHREPHPPRLIVNVGVQVCLLLFAAVVCPAAILDGLDICEQRWGHLDYAWVYCFYLVLFVGVLGLSHLCRNIIHILYDIVVHFSSPGTDRVLHASRAEMVRHPARRRIAKRLRAVAKEVLAEQPTHLLIMAHSQGTIIALEDLKCGWWRPLLKKLEHVQLITFGCPITHLYHHYMPVLYGDLTQSRWRRLREHVPNWINVYRVDDYVGTWVHPCVGEWPINVAVGPGLQLRGHTRYWETEVMRRLKRWLPRGSFPSDR